MWPAVLAGALLSLAPAAASAQSGIDDVIMTGRANGVELPASTIEWMRSRGPDAFEFQHVWRERAARVSARRAQFDAGRRERPTRGAADVVTTEELSRAGAALEGTFRMPLLLGLPSDRSAPHPVADYQDRMFGSGMGAYSLTALYDEMSNGMFDFTGDVIDWGGLPQNSTFYYGTGNVGNEIFGDTRAFIAHTVAAADPNVDFGLYDNDGPDGVPNSGDDDGYVDLAGFMFPAAGRECGGPGIWAHRSFVGGWGGGNLVTQDQTPGGDPILIADYIIQGGVDCDGTSLQHAGLVAHEAGHGFGLPDLYDTVGDGNGIGEWGLMGSGNWNEPHSPAHLSAHSKMVLGWIDVVTLLRDTTFTMAPIFDSHTAYRVNVNGVPNEYFLLENRQRLGSEVYLNGTGLLIWHVDSVKYAAGGAINGDAAHKAIDLEEADGLNQLDTPSNRGDAGDPWPGALARTSFEAGSTPSSNTYAAGVSNVEISDISESAGQVTLTINIPDPFTYGDVDGDESITSADLDSVLAYSLGADGVDIERQRGDVDEDGDVDARDAFIIHAYLEGRNTEGFRVGELGY